MAKADRKRRLARLFFIALLVGTRFFGAIGRKIFFGLKLAALCFLANRLLRTYRASKKVKRPLRRARFFQHWMRRFLSPSLLRMARFEGRIYSSAFAAVMRRPIPWLEPKTGILFGFVESRRYKATFFVNLVLMAVLLVLLGLYDRLFALAGLEFLVVYVLTAMVADAYALKNSSHQVNAGVLTFEMGFRARGRLRYGAIESISHVAEGPALDALVADRRSVTKITPGTAPNILIRLHEGQCVYFAFFVLRLPLKQHVAVYVDDPERFVSSVKRVAREL